MALTLKNLVQAMAAALAADTLIITKCQDLYNQPPTICVGAAGYQSPEIDDYPVFTVLGLSKDRSEDPNRSQFTYDVTLGLALHDDVLSAETTDEGVEIKTYRGAETVEDLLDMALAAVRSISPQLFYTQLVTDIEPLEFYPLFVGAISLTLGVETFLGGDEPSI